MIRYLFVSIVLHMSILLLLTINIINAVNGINVEPSAQTEENRYTEVIILPGEQGEKSKQHYWGVGLLSDQTLVDNMLCERVTEVFKGYSADATGIQVGDIIYTIDGKPMGYTNQIRGQGPKRMVFVIIRNKKYLTIVIDRVKVYYE